MKSREPERVVRSPRRSCSRDRGSCRTPAAGSGLRRRYWSSRRRARVVDELDLAAGRVGSARHAGLGGLDLAAEARRRRPATVGLAEVDRLAAGSRS